MALIQKAFSDIITFSRSSNATRIGPNGLVEYAPHNLILQSQTFDNASWTKSASSITANAIASPDGTVTSDKLVEDTTTAAHVAYQAVTITSGITYTFSIYAKVGGRNRISMGVSIINADALFNLSTGTVISTGSALVSSSITSIGNGWYRCSITHAATSTASRLFQVLPLNDSNVASYTGDGTSGIYLWGAQLSVGPLALDYTPTTTAAVYGPRFDYDGSGVTSVDPIARNLLTYSEQFDNASWTKSNVTATANAVVSPDGTTSADKIAASGTTSVQHAVTQTAGSPSTLQTLSIYAKAAEQSFLWLSLYDSTNRITWFNLTTGVVGTNASGSTASITAVGNGWYRCSITRTTDATAGPQAIIGFSNADNVAVYADTIGNGIYLWGAQLEIGSTATGYMVSGATNGFRAVPVVTGNATARGLLIEEQRTNLLTYSEQFDNAYWLTFSGTVTVTANATTAPDGTVTADLVIPTAASAFHRIYAPDHGQTTLSYSVFVKAGGYSKVALRESATQGSYISFNLTTGTIIESANVGTGTVSGATITSFGNGWYRISGYFVTPVNSAWGLVVLPDSYTSGNVTTAWTGNGTSGVYVWGAQAEVGSFATSYIPTVASSVTRSADVASVNTLSPWHNASESTLYCEFDYIGSTGSSVPAAFAKLSSASDDGMMVWRNVAGALFLYNGPAAFNNFGTLQPNTNYKTAIARDGSSGVTSANGSNQTAWASSVTATILRLGNYDGTQYFANGHLRRVSYYPRKLSSAELSALTA